MTQCNPKTDGTKGHHYLRRLLAPGYAKVYLAVHRVLGWPAVVHTPTRREERLPGGIEVVVSTGAEPANLTVEVRRGAGGPLVEMLEEGANLLRTALPLPGVLEHLQRAPRPRAPPRPRPAWRAWAGPVVLAVAMLLALWPTATTQPGEQVASESGTPEEMALSDVTSSSTQEPMRVRKRLLMPDGPIPGQDTPPCGKGYVALRGGCWAKLDAKAPNCPERSVEYQGGCYLPIKGASPVPMSVDRGQP